MATKLPNALIGAAGEYAIASELSRRGWLATVTIKNAPGTDVLAQHLESGWTVAIQSKTTAQTDWVLGRGDEHADIRGSEWYVLVGLGDPLSRPDFWVLPRNHVYVLVWVDHRSWLARPGRRGQPHKDTAMRTVRRVDIEPYRERWDALAADSRNMDYALPDWFREQVRVVGVPDDHPDQHRLSGEGE